MSVNVNQARAIYYDFFAGIFLHDLLREREDLIQKQLESISSSPLDDYTEKSFTVLNNEMKENGLKNIIVEFDNLFALPLTGEVVFPYVSHYKNECLNGEILVDIRQSVKELPIRANSEIFKETEDHFGFLFLIMRYCVEMKEHEKNEKEIFSFYINPYIGKFIADIVDNPKSNFYKEIALLLKSFMDFENSYIK